MRFNATTLERLKLELEGAFDRLDQPMEPKPVFACATSELPSAAAYANCVVRNTTLNILIVSDGANWIRQDTGASL